MERRLYDDLLAWKHSPRRKPLILDGARQTGKTWLLRSFGQQEFRRAHYLNFETDPKVCSIFAGDIRPRTTLPLMELHMDSPIDLANDLVFLDEIQTCARALTSLKYLAEEQPQLAVCAAGSLIGLSGSQQSYPVGKVTTMRLHPLSFREFLQAADPLLFAHYASFMTTPSPLPELVHHKLMEMLWRYFFVGGMPEAVAQYVASGVLDAQTSAQIRRTHADLVTGYRSDFAKHAGPLNANHLSRVFDAVPAQLSRAVEGGASRFTFRDVIPKARRYRELAAAIEWLSATGLVIPSMLIDDPTPPLVAHRKESMFKLYLLDVGLLHTMLDIAALAVLSQSWGSYKGYIAENFAATELRSAGVRELHTWTGRTAEIEFLLPADTGPIPIEVKSGSHIRRARSLAVYQDKYAPALVVKVSAANYRHDARMMHLPLYALGDLPELAGRAVSS